MAVSSLCALRGSLSCTKHSFMHYFSTPNILCTHRGDCGGGPLRMFFSNLAPAVDIGLRAFLIILPALHVVLWYTRAQKTLTGGRRHRMTRVRPDVESVVVVFYC